MFGHGEVHHWRQRGKWTPRFQRAGAPEKGELDDLVQLISQRVGRCLERLDGLVVESTCFMQINRYPFGCYGTPVNSGS
jgi:hypothetical protein